MDRQSSGLSDYRSSDRRLRKQSTEGLPRSIEVTEEEFSNPHGEWKRVYLIKPGDVPRLMQIFALLILYVLARIPARLGLLKSTDPQRLRRTFERLGATFLKVGQILSMRPDFLPLEYCDELMNFLDKLPPFSGETAEGIIERELGAPPRELFASFSPLAMAAATFGQVHRARLKGSGVEVVVKVQRPGIETQVERDLRILFFFGWLVDTLNISSTRLVPKVHEFARWTREELDYRWEARHQMQFRRNLRDVYEAVVPQVYYRYSARRVITMEFVHGTSIAEVLRAINERDESFFEKLVSRGYEGERVARNLHRNFLESAFRYDLFHADQHAGNLFVLEDNKIGYIDFGIVGKWDHGTQKIAMRFLTALNNEDVEEAFNIFSNEIALKSPASKLDRFEREFKQTIQDWLFHLQFKRSSPRQRSLARLLINLLMAVRRNKLELPLQTLAYYRTIITLDSIYLQIAPTYPAREVGKDYFEDLISDQIADEMFSEDGWRRTLRGFLEFVNTIPQRNREATRRDDDLLTNVDRLASRMTLLGGTVRKTLGRATVALVALAVLITPQGDALLSIGDHYEIVRGVVIGVLVLSCLGLLRGK